MRTLVPTHALAAALIAVAGTAGAARTEVRDCEFQLAIPVLQ
jgi:hypothetical protein